MITFDKAGFSDVPQFLLMQTAIIAPWMKYSFSRHINKHRTNELNAEQDRFEAEHNVKLDDMEN